MVQCSRHLVRQPLQSYTGRRVHSGWIPEGADKLVKLWDSYTGEIIRTLHGHNEGISDIAWSCDGDYLASASDDKTIILWSLELVSRLLGHR
jgi:WD40 repeat protein